MQGRGKRPASSSARAGSIGAAVVHENQFVIALQFVEKGRPLGEDAFEVRLLVVGEEDHADGLLGDGWKRRPVPALVGLVIVGAPVRSSTSGRS